MAKAQTQLARDALELKEANGGPTGWDHRPSSTLADDLLEGADEIAQYLGRPRRAIYHWVSAGLIPHVKVGALIFARKSELDRHFSADGARER